MNRSWLVCSLMISVVASSNHLKNSRYENINPDVEHWKNVIGQGIHDSLMWKYPDRNTEFQDYIRDKVIPSFGTFDFIIVGAGSSGATLASRLSENLHWNILLLEAGGNETEFGLIPLMALPHFRGPNNWGYRTTPQKYGCQGTIDKRCDYARGKTLGGSSALNAMLYVRGNPDDFDEWERQASGGWAYKDVVRYFEKSETYENFTISSKSRGNNGPLHVTHAKPYDQLIDVLIKAGNELGLPNVDYNGPKQMAATRLQNSIYKGFRESSNRAYLTPIYKKRPNLNIVTKALVTKVLFTGKKAIGVEFIYQNHVQQAFVSKEVILSAGAINTPQILMLSGIGLSSELKRLGIKQIVDLPVGQTLEEHPCSFFIPITSQLAGTETSFDESVRQLLTTGTGPLSFHLVQGISFLDTILRNVGKPNLEFFYLVAGGCKADEQVFYNNFNFDPKIMSQCYKTLNNSTTSAVSMVLLRSKSLGNVTLKSSNPIDHPIVDPNILSHPDDIEALYQGILFIKELMNTKAMKSINGQFLNASVPECNDIRDDPKRSDKDFWYCIIRYHTLPLYHAMGTTKMGKDPKTSVVNGDLGIHGLQNIRVIDCGVMPVLAGHPNANAIMLGERMSDWLKHRYA